MPSTLASFIQVLRKYPSLKSWIFSKYKRLCKSASSEAVSNVASALEGIFKSFADEVKMEDSQEDSDEDGTDPSNYITRQYSVPRIPNQSESSCDMSGKVSKSRGHDGSYGLSGQYSKTHSSVVPLDADLRPNTSTNHESGGLRYMDTDAAEHEDISHSQSSMPRDLLNNQLLSPVTRNPLDFRTNSFDGRNRSIQPEKNQVSNMEFSLPVLRSSSGSSNNVLASPRNHLAAAYSTTSQILWYSDGDPAAMDIFSASKQLWLGYITADTSESYIRFQFERFGPMEQFHFLPVKGFALIEYRNIMDAVKAWEYMREHSPWRIRFLDVGLGTRGTMNGVAIGSSSYVYIGNIHSQWAKDEILHQAMKVVYKGPYMITDRSIEGALLMEFENPEEAVAVMAYVRQHRKENNYHLRPLNAGLDNVARSHTDGARSVPTPVPIDIRSSEPESSAPELISPSMKTENYRATTQGGYASHSSWTVPVTTDLPEAGLRKVETYDNNMVVDPSQGGDDLSKNLFQIFTFSTKGFM